MEKLIQQLCADLCREDWLLWSGYFIDHKAAELEPSTLAALIERREQLLAQPVGLLGGCPVDEVIH